ncbi:hypothetical protein R8Z50_19170 [Longispora sp. K20-0274]
MGKLVVIAHADGTGHVIMVGPTGDPAALTWIVNRRFDSRAEVLDCV